METPLPLLQIVASRTDPPPTLPYPTPQVQKTSHTTVTVWIVKADVFMGTEA